MDDEPVIRRLLARSLEKAFTMYEVESVASILQLPEQLSGEIDRLITDMKMPNRDGLERVSEMKKDYAEILIVICTGDNTYCDFDGMIDSGEIAGVLEKPITAAQATESIRMILQR